MFVLCLKQQPRQGFATEAVIIWSMRTKVHPVNPAASFCYHLNNAMIDFESRLKRDDLPTNCGLVGNHNDFVWRFCQSGKTGQRSGKEGDILPGAHVLIPVFDDHSITIKEDGTVHKENYTSGTDQ